MDKTNTKNKIQLIAPAKVNLFLHITGKREDSYHELQSLVAFSDFGDEITITKADKFSFSFDSTSENLPTNENNIIICAANLLAVELGCELNCHIHLSKKIPIGAGLGGGSSDAATTIKGLLEFWQMDIGTDIEQDRLNTLLLTLGADVPVCYYQKPSYFEGVGDIITPTQLLTPLHALLVYPNQYCSTQEIFSNYNSKFSRKITLPKKIKNQESFIDFLKEQQNDLTNPAIENIPDIQNILEVLQDQKGCLLSRMSGSGSACFGLFDTEKEAHDIAHTLQHSHPDWWAQAITFT